MVTTGFTVTMKLVSGGTCSCSGDVTSLTGGTCTTIPYLDSYSFNGQRALIEYTGFGDKIAKNLPGMPSASIDFSGGLDLTNAQQLNFWNSLACSSPATRIMRVVDGGKTLTMKGYITGTQSGSTPSGKSTFASTLTLTQLPKTC